MSIRKWISGLTLAVTIMVPHRAVSQSAVQITLGPDGLRAVPETVVLSARNTKVAVTCAARFDCAQLAVSVEAGTDHRAPASRDSARGRTTFFTVNAEMLNGNTAGQLAFRRGSTLLGGISASADAASDTAEGVRVTDGQRPAAPTGPTTGALLTRYCDTLSAARRAMSTALYSERRDSARFVVTPVGNVLARPGDVIDEDDMISVVVVGDTSIIDRLVVTRTSDFRTPGDIRIVGEGLSLEDLRKGGGAALRPRCVAREFAVSDFAPGQGKVQISLVGDDGAKKEVGAFDFGVHSLYSGAFSFGPVRTLLRDPEYGVVARGDSSYVTATEDGTPRVLYVLGFTPFLWGRRELERSVPWYEHINPTIGIVPAHVQDNAILGLSVDVLNSVYLHGGVHAGRVKQLDPRANLRVGDAFSGTGAVPTISEWDADWFMGVTIDLRAAVEFLKVAATGAAGS